jgi:hypothetical protein
MGLTGSAPNVIERVDQGATFYKKFFFGQGKTFVIHSSPYFLEIF